MIPTDETLGGETTKTKIIIAVALVCGLAFTSARAQKMKTEIPHEMTTPDSVETSLGTLRFSDGLPDQATVEKVYGNLDRMSGGKEPNTREALKILLI